MIFDLLSFVAGIAAGGLTGVLGGIVYSFERTADLQESLLKLRKKIDSIDPAIAVGQQDPELRATIQGLRAQLDAIHEEIRSMYKKTTH